jgi:hypothetical protein
MGGWDGNVDEAGNIYMQHEFGLVMVGLEVGCDWDG